MNTEATIPVLPVTANGYNGYHHSRDDGWDPAEAGLVQANHLAINQNALAVELRALTDTIGRNSKENAEEILRNSKENHGEVLRLREMIACQGKDFAELKTELVRQGLEMKLALQQMQIEGLRATVLDLKLPKTP
jgi:uncharacterized coiled-coil protein SlyX